MASKEVIIIGAGPYGLSTAAYLKAAGLEPYVIGQPMRFWREQMPRGMFLRSGIEASNIAAPQRSLSIAAYEKAIRRKLTEPLPVADFIAYGEWFQKQVVPNLDTRHVKNLARDGSGFGLTLDDGDRLYCQAVVLALGIGQFAQRPEQFVALPKELVSHTSDLADLSPFRRKRLAVIGKGQSALEYAALLHEQKADVQIVTRSGFIDYLPPRWRLRLFRNLTPGPLRPLSYMIRPPTDLGNIRTARLIADPDKFRKQSPEVQNALLGSVKRPIGSQWLRSRLKDVAVRTGMTVEAVDVVDDRIRLVFTNGITDWVDRVVLATGYRIDASRNPLLDSLRGELQLKDGYPVLTTGLETSIQGLFMAGVIAEKTLGPTLRFVTGTSNAGPRLAAAIGSFLRARRNHL